MPKDSVLPRGGVMPRLVFRELAAAYAGMSPTKFDSLVADGRLPKPVHIDGLVRWDIHKLDLAISELIDEDAADANYFKSRTKPKC